MKNSQEPQTDVQNAIKWGLLLSAEHASGNAIGVNPPATKLEAKFPNAWAKANAEIAGKVLAALNLNGLVPSDSITVKAENGWITLEGELLWNYQGEAAKNTVTSLVCVKGVTNNIKIKSEVQDAIEQADVEHAIAGNWSVIDSDINVTVSGTTVTLTGKVHSRFHKEEAGRIAWKTPGIWQVKNELAVDYEFAFT